MATFTFTRGASTLVLPLYHFPVQDRVASGVLAARTAAGEAVTNRKAPAHTLLVRHFTGIRDEDFQGLKAWYLTEADGATNTFTATEPDGTAYTVRWVDEELRWQRDDRNRWSGTIALLVEA